MPAKVTRKKEQRMTLNVRAALRSLALLCLAASAASAQIGGPNSAAKEAAKAKAESAKTEKAKAESVPQPAAPSSVSQRFEREGVAIDFSLKSNPEKDGPDAGLVAGSNAIATVRLTDARTGAPLTGYHPNAWISSRASEQTSDGQCRDKITTLLGGLLSERADVDLNGYTLLTLNHDNTITFINPQLSFNVTKLESIVILPGSGADWVLSADKNFLYVTLPEQSSIAVIDTNTRKLAGMITAGGAAKPRRIALQPDGRYVWVALDDTPTVAVIDARTNKLARTLEVGAGLHSIAFTDDSRFAYISNSAADTVSALDTRTLTKVADIEVGKTPGPVAYSKMGRLVYVAAVNGGVISAIDPASQRVVKSVPSSRGVVALRFEEGGRFGFVVNQPQSTVSILDASTNAVTGSTRVTKEPDQVSFTDRYAYVRGTGSEKFTLIELKDLDKGRLAPIDIQAGTTPANAFPEEVGVSGMIAPTPEGNSVMVASTADQSIFYYAEGLMAPMGTFSNYKRRPHALMLLDRSLSEVAPGVYSSPLKLPQAGAFDVPVLVDQLRMFKCFDLRVAESANPEERHAGPSITAEAAFKDQTFKAGEQAKLTFRILDSVTKQPVVGLGDVQVLVFEPPGVWQQRQWAREVGKGVYETTQVFPRDGLYYVMLRVKSRGIWFNDLAHTPVPVAAK
jgi:YVTN family beta-propeller protein